jgi:hypothetical protein
MNMTARAARWSASHRRKAVLGWLATVVRAVLLPATMSLLGDWNWYLPRWLEWLPRLSAEAPVEKEEDRLVKPAALIPN